MALDQTDRPALRHLYEGCPLCESKRMRQVKEEDCRKHARYQSELPPTMVWLACDDCGHCFTEGYWAEEGLNIVFRRTYDVQDPSVFFEKPKDNKPVAEFPIERHRIFSARTVSRVTAARRGLPKPGAKWLDVGFGNGTLLFTAAEWGYLPIGLDLRQKSVDQIKRMGIEAHCVPIEDYQAGDGSIAVVSLANVIEHMPFPKLALKRICSLLAPDGVILVSTPNLDTYVWGYLDYADRNPYWYEIEHYHIFSRPRLYALLQEFGFAVVDYQITDRYRTGMEVIARKAG